MDLFLEEDRYWESREGVTAKNNRQKGCGNQALILYAWGKLEDVMALYKKQEALCLDLGNKDSLQISYGNQAEVLRKMGKFEDALALHKGKKTFV